MKLNLSLFSLLLIFQSAISVVSAQDYSYFIRQIQMPDNLAYDVSVSQKGERFSEFAINPEGARFELWTVKSDPLTSFLLDNTYVNSYIPVAEVKVTTEDPYEVIPRTRADRPFTVNITINGLSSDPSAPPAAQSVKLLRHNQVYQTKGTGKNTDRGNATLVSEGSISANGDHTLTYDVTSLTSTDLSKIRGEERFSVFSLADYQAPESQLDSAFVQIWPVASATLTGLANDALIKELVPEITIDLQDLYPDSWTYTQVYEGAPALGTNGIMVPGSSIIVDSSVPRDEALVLRDWDRVLRRDGTWTMEVITVTPFGADRLAYRTFEVERAIRINGAVTSVE